VFGLDLVDLDADGVSKFVIEQRPNEVHLVVTPNIDHLRLLRTPSFRAAYEFATIICPDGFPVALYARLRGVGSGIRVTGCDVFHHISMRANAACKRVVVVAESIETANAIEDWAARQGGGAVWKAILAPERLCDDTRGQQWLATNINANAPDILVLTVGAPASEIFVYHNRTALMPCWALCLGQAVRVELGLTPRAPVIFQRCHMEWAWRIALEPRRLAGRYFRSALAFPAAILADLRRC
jgi:N-acetylglucosaminyldiphosphoundecaprenol N-acetyl-beta-D-mannosaminyltransferase